VSACAPKLPEPEYADGMTESILLAINSGDYTVYSENMDETMRTAIPELKFKKSYTLIKSKIGDYVSKHFLKTESKAPYTIVYYTAKFTGEPKDVIVKVVFQEIQGKVFVSGLWFDSPQLRK